MKNLGLLMLLVAILFSSCSKKTIPMGKTVTKNDVPAPYVQPINGIAVNAKEVFLKGNKIVADNKKFKYRDVQCYSTGTTEYFKTKGFNFAKKIYTGDLNVLSYTSYHTTYTPYGTGGGGSYHSYRSVKYYFQTNNSPTVMVMNYKNLKDYIKSSEPAYDYLQKSHTGNIIGNTIIGVSAGVFALAISKMLLNNGENFGDGFNIFAGGAAIYITGAAFKLGAVQNLKKSIGMHNKSWTPGSN